MEANQIRYFLAACNSLNFTRAAEACGVAVPTLSRAIKSLEDEFGGPLFRRERHVTSLSDLGRLMRQHLSEAQRRIDAAQEVAERYARTGGRMILGVLSTMPPDLLVAYLQNLRTEMPDLELQMWEAHCTDLADALTAGQIDIALMSLPEYDDRFLPVPLLEEPYTIAFAPGHRFEKMSAVPLSEMEGEPYVRRLNCEFPANFAELCVDRPYNSVSTRYVTEREDWIQTMVRSGLGVAFMPAYLPTQPGLLTRPMIDPTVTRTISIVTVAGRQHSNLVKLALEVAGDTDWEQRGGTFDA